MYTEYGMRYAAYGMRYVVCSIQYIVNDISFIFLKILPDMMAKSAELTSGRLVESN